MQDASNDGSKKQFDTFETNFFQQGEDSASIPVEVEHFDELDGGGKHFFLSRQSLSSIAIVSTCVAVLACIALWRSNSQASALAAASVLSTAVAPVRTAAMVPSPAPMAVPTKLQPAQPTPGQDSTAPSAAVKVEPVPTGSPVAVHAEPVSNDPAPAQMNPNSAAKAEAIPATVPALVPQATPVVAKNENIPPAMPTPIKVETTPPAPAHGTVAEQPSQDSRDKLAAEAAPATQPGADDARSRCKKAIGGKRNGEILDLCPDVFARDPSAAYIAVALARIEFDRGRYAPACAWGKRAIAANPDIADAYVFVGGAEQNAGHGKSAKEAYAHYLKLAPSGRYAADLRAIVNSL